MLPRGCEEVENAGRLVAAGLAREADARDSDGAVLRQQVERLLTDQSHRDNARRLRDEIEDVHAPGRLVRSLECLTDPGPAGWSGGADSSALLAGR